MEQVLKLSIDFGMIIVKTIEVTLQFLIMLWPVWLIFGIVIFLKFLFVILIPEWLERRRNHKRFVEGEEWRSDRDLIYWLRGMKPDEFENYIADLFSRLGFKTEVVGGSHDGGIDVVAEQNGIKHYIQCKKFINRACLRGKILSKKEFAIAEEIRISRNRIHVSGLKEIDNLYSKEQLDAIFDKANKIIRKVEKKLVKI